VQGGDGESWVSPGVLGPALGGLAVLALFAWYESRIEHPSLDVRLFKNRSLSASVGSRGKHDPTPAAPGFVDRAVDELLRGIAVDRAG
jgi:hypothetical protein